MKPVIMRMVVDLPAPLGPRKPSTSPRSTPNEMPSTARFAPKVFTRFSILIIGLELRKGGIIAQLVAESRPTSLPRFPEEKIMRALISPLAAVLVALSSAAAAQQYPAKPIRIVVPFA